VLYGAEVSPRRAQDATALKAFGSYLEVLAFSVSAAAHYAQIRADLKRRGQMIGANDLLMPLTLASLELKLTSNVAELGRVKGLALEDSMRPGRRSRSADDE
jgi:tRNA(fMet)-specific endonuclease VapC